MKHDLAVEIALGQTPTNAVAAISVAAMKLDTSPELVRAPLQRSSGRSGGSTTACHAVNTHDGELKRVATWWRGSKRVSLPLVR